MDTAERPGLLLLCQSAGEAAGAPGAPALPGPVLGLAADGGAAAVAGRARAGGGGGRRRCCNHLSLLFVPVGVGVMTTWADWQHGLRMLLALVLSTWIGLAVTAWVLHCLLPARRHRQAGRTHGQG
jgi:holin-like protein